MIKRTVSLIVAVVLLLTLPLTVHASTDAELLLNEAGLSPRSPNSQALDEYLDDIMIQILHDEMSTLEKLSACYDYLTDTMQYGSHTARLSTPIGDTTCRSIYNSYGEIEGYGAVALTSRTGLCNAYAAAFILMAGKIGVHLNLVEGSTRSSGGGYAYHKWAELVIDDVAYVFDPQLDQDLSAAGLPYHSVFFKTYDQVSGRYIKS